MSRDFSPANHGSICLLTPLTRRGLAWVDAHIPASIVIEPRYVEDIAIGIAGDGLTVS